MHAQCGRLAHDNPEHYIKLLDEYLSNVIFQPSVKDSVEELPVLNGADASFADSRFGLFHYRDELKERGANFFQEVVYLDGVATVAALDDRQRVEFHLVPAQGLEALHDSRESALASSIATELVV